MIMMMASTSSLPQGRGIVFDVVEIIMGSPYKTYTAIEASKSIV
jgi:hypothetical protein